MFFLFLLLLPVFGFSAEVTVPKFPFGFIVRDYFKEAGITNQILVTNTPRMIVFNADKPKEVATKEYLFYIGDHFTVGLYIDGKLTYIYSVYRNNVGYFYDKVQVVKKIGDRYGY